jgi:hypothetical protein
MRLFVVLTLVALAVARPEAGYSYNVPNRGFGSGISQGIVGGGGIGGGGLQLGGGGLGGGGGGLGLSTIGLSTGSGSNFIGSGSGGFSQSISGFGQGAQLGPAPQQIIQKHIYVHVPPPEPEEYRQQTQLNLGVPQKHYKIIFIKAPSPPQPSQAQIALAAQNQEKTIVYVLVKKPDDISDIAIPSIAPIQPSKPEVYFIKYKTQRGQSSGPVLSTNQNVSGGAGGIGLNSIGGGIIESGLDSSLLTDGSNVSGQSIGNVIQGTPASSYGPPGHSGPY